MAQVVIAHVSDVHFADQAFPSPGTQYPRRQEGHDVALCQALPSGLVELRRWAGLATSDHLLLVVSGDLSRTGTKPEFDVGCDYFNGPQQSPFGRPAIRLGLEQPGGQTQMVSGNHDHWNGGASWPFLPAFNPSIIWSPFRRTPYVEPIQVGDLLVEVCGMDSNSGNARYRWSPRQRGRIDAAQFRTLNQLLRNRSAMLPPATVHRVRILVCHHSFQTSGRFNWFTGGLALNNSSKRDILNLAESQQIVAMLSGHIHTFLPDHYTTPGGRLLREFRSATTLQQQPQSVPFLHGFWGHRIETVQIGGSTEVWWESQPFSWDGQDFVRINLPTAKSQLRWRVI